MIKSNVSLFCQTNHKNVEYRLELQERQYSVHVSKQTIQLTMHFYVHVMFV